VPDAEPTALEPLLAPVIAAGELLATQHGHTFTAVIEPGLPPITVSSSMIRQALDNLLTNAVLYTPGHGTITLDARRAGSNIVIAVRDTGIGIAPADLAHIFEDFYRADKARSSQTGGAGLGLAIARRIALAHGGDIQVASEVGVGSTFTLRLPLLPAVG
jgi:two-component system sensor histidine kinase BaeS